MPNFGPGPGTYELGPLGYTLFGLAIVSTLVMGVAIIAMVLQVRWFAVARRVFVVSAAVLVLGLVVSFVLDRSGRAAARDALHEEAAQKNRLTDELKVELERVYGMSYEDEYPFIPLDNGHYSREVLVLSDGSVRECFTVAEEDGFYRIRCGGDRPEEGVELEPVTS